MQLRNAGVLDAVAVIVLGSFTEDDDPAAVLREHLAALGKPVLAGRPAGHGRPNRVLPLGVRVALATRVGRLTLQEPVTELCV